MATERRWRLLARAFGLACAVQLAVMLLFARLLPVRWLQDVGVGVFFAVVWSYRPGWTRPRAGTAVLAQAVVLLAAYLLVVRLLVPELARL